MLCREGADVKDQEGISCYTCSQPIYGMLTQHCLLKPHHAGMGASVHDVLLPCTGSNMERTKFDKPLNKVCHSVVLRLLLDIVAGCASEVRLDSF